MKFLLPLLSIIMCVTSDADVTNLDKFEEFKEVYGREYQNPEEEKTRFYIFQQNLRTIDEHNTKYHNGEKSYYMGITPFADFTPIEFQSMLNYSKSSSSAKPYQVTVLNEIPDSKVPGFKNWYREGVIGEVKDQGFCGSCWAFTATGAMEAAYAIKTGTQVDLSEQNLMDCSSLYGNSGCSGGLVESAYKYVRDFGIETEEEYPYSGRMDECQYLPGKSAIKLATYHTLLAGNEEALRKAVGTVGPVSVGMNAHYLQFYSGGIFYEPGCDRVANHGMLIVGYGMEEETPYWILKNSWGPYWGEKGYLRMIRNKHNQCGISDTATYPVIA